MLYKTQNTKNTQELLEDFLRFKVNWPFFLEQTGLCRGSINNAKFINLEEDKITLDVEVDDYDDRHCESYNELKTFSLENIKKTLLRHQRINRFDTRWFSCKNGAEQFYKLTDEITSEYQKKSALSTSSRQEEKRQSSSITM